MSANPHHARARTAVAELDRDVALWLKTIRDRLQPEDDSPEDVALCSLEVFAAVSLRVMRKTNPSKIRDEARTVEIKARLDGKPECLGSITG